MRIMQKNWKQSEKAKMCGHVCADPKAGYRCSKLKFNEIKLKVRNSTTTVNTYFYTFDSLACGNC